MIREVRPHQVFRQVRTHSFHERMMQVVLPEQDTPVLLETAVLVALARLSEARTLFEFGTFRGVQTLNLVANMPPGSHAYTLDLGKEDLEGLAQDPHDAPLTEKHLQCAESLAFQGSPWEDRVTALTGDSKRFDFVPYHGRMDMVYIDGGHDLATLRADTENALEMLARRPLSCIAWHDHGNEKYPWLTEYLEELSESLSICHVGRTMLCFHLNAAPDGLWDGA